LNDSDDFLDPDELIDAASQDLLAALATLERVRRALHGQAEPLRPEPANVIRFLPRPKNVSPSPGGRGDDGRGGQGVRGHRRTRRD